MELQYEASRRNMFEPLICRVCGDRARGMNFDVLTCVSCKSFFRRNALRPRVSCHFTPTKLSSSFN